MVKSIGLAWIVVKDLKKAIKFYTEVVGLELKEVQEEFGWAELEGRNGDGAKLGIAVENDIDNMKPGSNAVVTMTVDNLDKAVKEMHKKGVKLEGGVMEIPGQVKLQTMKDSDGNHFQLVELL